MALFENNAPRCCVATLVHFTDCLSLSYYKRRCDVIDVIGITFRCVGVTLSINEGGVTRGNLTILLARLHADRAFRLAYDSTH